MTNRECQELLAFLFGDASGEPAVRCLAWILDEPRFASFLQRHREKIRKKVRTAPGDEGLRDLLVELQCAYHVLRERRFDLAYEAYVAAKTRGPDFTVIYKGHTSFNIEVKRLRAGALQPSAFEARFVDAVCDKLHQMPPSTINILAIVAENAPERFDLAATLRRLVARAERADVTLLARYGFTGTRDFFACVRRLSAVLMRQSSSLTASTLWRNPQARHPLHPDLPPLLVR